MSDVMWLLLRYLVSRPPANRCVFADKSSPRRKQSNNGVKQPLSSVKQLLNRVLASFATVDKGSICLFSRYAEIVHL